MVNPIGMSVTATETKSGASPSIITAPKSPLTAPAVFPAVSLTVPEYEDTDKSLLFVSPSATVYLKTNAAEPVPL